MKIHYYNAISENYAKISARTLRDHCYKKRRFTDEQN